MNEKAVVNGGRGFFAMCGAIFSFIANSVTELVIVLAILMVVDYATGVLASYIEQQIDSSKSLGKINFKRGFTGVCKKIGYLILVGLAILLDYIIYYMGNTAAGIQLGFKGIFTLVVTCWLIGTEAISLIENLGRIGVPIPNFLSKAFIKLKDTVEKVGGENDYE
ncbi:phage holin family protein [Vallitalea guaymasensis]|uniref:phage holin family protein n=1 Tax=Vallitalea guaymasensis TaxID=1185412 RepID=UPI00187D4F19|nr:phage holin family protein [Vallitalea guaymasensis]